MKLSPTEAGAPGSKCVGEPSVRAEPEPALGAPPASRPGDAPPVEGGLPAPVGPSHPADDPRGRRKKRPKVWQASLGLLVGAVASQLSAGVTLLLVLVASGLTAEGRLLGPSYPAVFAAVVCSGVVLTATAFGTVLLCGADIRESLGLRRVPIPVLLLSALGMVALAPTSEVLLKLMQAVVPTLTTGALDELQRTAANAPLLYALPAMALVPGFAEEVIFRGLFQRSFRRAAVAVPLSALLFSAFHFDPHHVAAVLPLGFYLAWLGARTASLVAPAVAHVSNNALAVIRASPDSLADLPPLSLGEVGWMVGGWLGLALIVWAMRACLPPTVRATPGQRAPSQQATDA